jgi:hypothetical protein
VAVTGSVVGVTEFRSRIDHRMALAREWDDLIEQVRHLDGFADFLAPPEPADLLAVAGRGPVVVVNVSRWRCDALLVGPTGVEVVPLGVTLQDTVARADGYLAVLRSAERADRERLSAPSAGGPGGGRGGARRRLAADRAVERAHEQVDAMLRDLQTWLWDAVAEPVLSALGFTGTPPGDVAAWPRIWWCPTGPLTLLPLHTAGYHAEAAGGERPPRTVLDRVVSSYTPTVAALVASRRPGPTIRRRRDTLLLVDLPDTPGQAPLDTSAERRALLDAFPRRRRTVLERGDATRDRVRAALAEHRWAHFSCHGDQHLADPSRGGLLLHDGTLSVADLGDGSGRFSGDFAGLSACKTAVGGVDLLDEAVTLATALHVTGFRHVVAALWSVDSRTSAEVFARLYREIAGRGRLEPDRAPAVLNRVVRDLRDRNPGWPHRWTPFMHTGP